MRCENDGRVRVNNALRLVSVSFEEDRNDF